MQRASGTVPGLRISVLNGARIQEEGEYVLYWMTAFRRRAYNFALQRSVERARQLNKPLLVFEGLRCDYPWASDRFHAFVLQGMMANLRSITQGGARHFPYVEREAGEGKGLLEALARRACLVVMDDHPGFFLPAMRRAAAARLNVALEAVDSNGFVPLRAAPGPFSTAHAFRRFLQKDMLEHLLASPLPDPLDGAGLPQLRAFPSGIVERWPPADAGLFSGAAEHLRPLPLNHAVPPSPLPGGEAAARRHLAGFVAGKLTRYAEDRNHPDREGASGLSPYLHFGHISAHEVFAAVAGREGWSPDHLSVKAAGSRTGWWGMSASAEAFVDQLVTWRELAFNSAAHMARYDEYESLPAWARAALGAHGADRRPHLYSPQDLEGARTHDALWNAAQRQLVREGRLHTYLRMLWGKKILEWSPTPQAALETMTRLNDTYALDGRDPNSVAGIFWTLGRYDRPWGPIRPIFGTVRYMSSENTARKVSVKSYLERFSE